MKQQPILQTHRLVLRPFGFDDAADVQLLANDWAIADTTVNIPHPYQNGMGACSVRLLEDNRDIP